MQASMSHDSLDSGNSSQSQANEEKYKKLLKKVIDEKKIDRIYPPGDNRLNGYVANAQPKLAKLAVDWRVPIDQVQDLFKLALFDVIVYIGKPCPKVAKSLAKVHKMTAARCLSRLPGIELWELHLRNDPASTPSSISSNKSPSQRRFLTQTVSRYASLTVRPSTDMIV